MRRREKLLASIPILLLAGGILSAIQPVHGGVAFQATWGGGANDIAQGVAVDSFGNAYITGYTNSFGLGTHVFLLKLDAAGNVTWQRIWKENSEDYGKGVALDGAANAYVVGYTSSLSSGNNLLLLKFNSSGSLLWQRTWGTPYDDLGQGIAVAPSGNIYVTGYTYNAAAGQTNAILLKFNSTGNMVWQRTWGGSTGTIGQGVASDANDNIYMTGLTLPASIGGTDAFILKFNANGTILWQETWGGTADDVGYGVAVDPSNNNNIYVTGSTLSTGAGDVDTFALKLNPSGTMLWQRTWGGTGPDIGQAISIDNLGYVYVTGTTQSFGAGPGDVFLLAIDGPGSLRWETLWGGSGGDNGFGVAAAQNGYAIVTGYVSEASPYATSTGSTALASPGTEVVNINSVALDVGTPTASSLPTSGSISIPSGSTTYAGQQDAFVLMYGAPTPPSPPQKVVAKGYVGYVALNWTAPAFNGFSAVTGYKIYRGTTSNKEIAVATIGNVTSYSDLGLQGGITYYYKITARNIIGESAFSSEVSAIPTSAPTPPRSLFATASIQTVQLNWTTPSGNGGSPITGYNVLRGAASGAENLIANIGVQNSYLDSSLTGGVKYYYKVTAVNAIGESAFSNEVSATPTSQPTPPQNLQAIPSAGKIILTWTAPASNGGSPITGYNINRGLFAGGETKLVQLLNQLTYTDNAVNNNTLYFYTVTALNGVGESVPSNEVNAESSASPQVPSAARFLNATAGKNSILLNWTAPVSNGGSDITGYDVWLGFAPSNIVFFQAIGNQTSFNNTGLTAGTTYFYQVAARSSLGEGALSNIASSVPFTTPSAPQNLQAFASLNKSVLTWNPPTTNGFSPITGYRIYRGITSGGETFLTASGNQTSFVDTVVTPGTQYFYTITAVNSGGESARSQEANATPSPAPVAPSPPQNLTAIGGNTTVTLTWTPPISNGGANITGYEITRALLSGAETSFRTVGNVTSFVDTGLTGGVPYFYEVKAINSVAHSSPSNEASATPISPPTAPGNLVATGGIGNITLTWTLPSSNGGSTITKYGIYRATAAGGETLLTTIAAPAQLTFVDTSTTPGTTYYYKVTAINSLGQSGFSNEASSKSAISPAAPSGLVATGNVNNVTLTWAAPTSNRGAPIIGYNIYRSNSSGAEVFLASTGNITRFTDASVSGGTTYFYKVTAVNGAGESALSNEASAQPISVSLAPRNIIATGGVGNVTLTWIAPASNNGSSITGYNIYRGTLGGAEIFLKSISNITTFTDTSVTIGQTYYYYVTAVNGVGQSSHSAEVSAVPTSPPVTVPSAPQGLLATPTSTGIDLTWNPPSSNGGASIASYEIFRGTSPGSETLLTTIAGSQVSYSDDTATNGTTYYYYVEAVNSAGGSPQSNEVSAVFLLPQTAANPPQNLKATPISGAVNLTWSTPSPSSSAATITGYNIYRATSSGSEVLIASVQNVTTYLDQTVIAGTTYYYKITTVNSVGESAQSSEATVTVPPASLPIIPIAIAALVLVAVGALGVILWRRRVSRRLLMPP